MKLSLNLPDDDNNHQNPILKAELPISIFNQPFNSIFTTATNSFSDIHFSVSTNFPTGPSLKLSYSPPTTTTPSSPISVSLKSGLGLFGSPHNSPLVFSAHFSLSSASPVAIIPTFSLHFKPQLGHFSLHKRTASSSDPNPDPDSGTHLVAGSHLDSVSSSNLEFGNVYAPDSVGSMGWQEVKLEPVTGKEKEGFANPNPNDIDGAYAPNGGIFGFLPERHLVPEDRKKGGFSGVAVKARTVVPLSKRVKMNLRWGVNLPGDMGIKMPYLTVNKIVVERIEEMKETKEKSSEYTKGDLELLKGMCFWMRRDLEIIEKENRDMKQILEYMRSRVSTRNLGGENSVGKKVPASSDRLGEFWQSKRKKNDEAYGQTELKKPTNPVTDLESELQKAIKAAAS